MLWPQQLFLLSVLLTWYSKLQLPLLDRPGAFSPLYVITTFLGIAVQAFWYKLGKYQKMERKI